MHRIFEVLDRGYIADSDMTSLSAVAIQTWADVVLSDISDELTHTVTSIIKRHRITTTEDIDAASETLVRSCKDMFCTIGVQNHRDFNKIKYFTARSKQKSNID